MIKSENLILVSLFLFALIAPTVFVLAMINWMSK